MLAGDPTDGDGSEGDGQHIDEYQSRYHSHPTEWERQQYVSDTYCPIRDVVEEVEITLQERVTQVGGVVLTVVDLEEWMSRPSVGMQYNEEEGKVR